MELKPEAGTAQSV